MDTISERIEQALKPLIGLPLWKIGRSGLVWLHFGERHSEFNKKGDLLEWGDYTLNIECAWRITRGLHIFLAEADRYVLARKYQDYPEDWDYQAFGENLFDEKVVKFNTIAGFSSNTEYIVESLKADCYGGFCLNFHTNIQLQVFPDKSANSEQWRFISRGDETPHFVICVNDEGIAFVE